LNIYTIIPARGGSKGITKKNIRLLKGKPLIDYSINYSLRSKLVKRTIVSTDSEEIAAIALKSNAEIPFIRPKYLAQDLTPDFPVFKHALFELEKIYNEKIDLLILLRPTSPNRPKGLIEIGVKKMIDNQKASSLRSVALSKEHPYRQWFQEGEYIKGFTKNIKEPFNIPRQIIPKSYFQTGDIEIIRRSTILKGSISGENVLPLIIKHSQILDIDSEKDWKNAEKS
tara:strand:+ start:232 stop:912 length:681 start_codon:yes stop_codon:yes gene_type:complete